ncbi:hypothetical protein N9852_03010 [Alphaproteobacteria bacterium]|nr:hypothetical protein [Alphaproteobacteria bacterium]
MYIGFNTKKNTFLNYFQINNGFSSPIHSSVFLPMTYSITELRRHDQKNNLIVGIHAD